MPGGASDKFEFWYFPLLSIVCLGLQLFNELTLKKKKKCSETICKDYKQQCILCLQQPCTDIAGVPKAILFDLSSKAISPGQLILAGPCGRGSVKTSLVPYSHMKKKKAQWVIKLSGDVLHWHLGSSLLWECFFSSSGDWLLLVPTKEWISSPYIFLKSTSLFKLKMTKAKVRGGTSELLLEWPLGQCAPPHLAAEQQDQLVCLRATFPLSPRPKLFGVGVWAVPPLSLSGNTVAQNPLLSRSPVQLQGILLPVTLRTICRAQY